MKLRLTNDFCLINNSEDLLKPLKEDNTCQIT